MSVTHNKVATLPDDPAYEVGSTEWNQAHTGVIDDTMHGSRGKNLHTGQLPVFNVVTDYSADSTGATDSTTACQNAIAAAAVAGGIVYFPAGVYAVSTLTITDNTSGIVLQGAGVGSGIKGPNAVNPIVVNISGASSGSVANVTIRDLFISYHGSSTNTTGIKISNCLHFTIENVKVLANGIPWSVQGSGNGVFLNAEGYVQQSPVAGNAALMIGDGSGTLTSPGPLHFVGGQFSGGGTNGTPALRIADSGSAISTVFTGTMFQANGGGTGKHTIYVDGTTTSATFVECYAESTYNSNNDGATFIIGSTTKAASVKIIGGDYWGHGNSTNYQEDFVRVVDCKQLVVEGVRTDKLAATNGFSRAMIRFESTAMDAGDMVMCIANDKGNINGTTYSDGGSGRGINTASNGAFFFGTDTIDTLPNKQSGTGIRTAGNLTTASGTMADATDVTVTLTLGTMTSGKVFISVSGTHFNDGAGNTNSFQIVVDSTVVKIVPMQVVNLNQNTELSMSHLATGLAAGAHTFKLQWATTGGNATLNGGTTTSRTTSITAVEI